jgi:hypothetical protein
LFLGINTAERFDRYQTLVAGVWHTKAAREDSCHLPAPQDSFSALADVRTAFRAKTHRRASLNHGAGIPPYSGPTNGDHENHYRRGYIGTAHHRFRDLFGSRADGRSGHLVPGLILRHWLSPMGSSLVPKVGCESLASIFRRARFIGRRIALQNSRLLNLEEAVAVVNEIYAWPKI